MRFAVLCDDPSANPVIDALRRHVSGHQLSYVVRATQHPDTMLSREAEIRVVDCWQDVPMGNEIDAALVGGSDASVLDGAKQLATAEIPLLFIPHAAQGSTFVYELSLIHDDNQVVLFPFFRHRYDAAVTELKRSLDSGQLGKIQFLQLNRALPRASTNTPISQAEVDAELLHDVDLLRWLIGDYDQVTALRTAATNEGLLMQSVVLAGRSLPEANWSIRPFDGPEQWQLTVRGENGVADLQRDASSHHWICEIAEQRVEGDDGASVQNAIDAFAETTERHAQSDSTIRGAVSSEWADVVKCFETVDATHRSVRRRRTIELHFEPMSERAIFKTQMTALGCGVLVATFFLALLYLAVATFIEPVQSGSTASISQSNSVDDSNQASELGVRNTPLPITHRILIGLRILVFAPLVLFLLAQILLPLARPSSNDQQLAKAKVK